MIMGLRVLSAVAISLLLSIPALAELAGWPSSIMIGTASPGGPYYVYGQAVARVVARALNIETDAQVTQGPAQNIVLMEKREAMLGFITSGVGLQAWGGTGWANGMRYRSMRVIFPMYDTAFQFAAPSRLGIRSLNDLAGRRVGVGPRAGTGGSYVPSMFKALSVKADIRYGGWDGLTSQLSKGDLDAAAFVGGIPFPALSALSAREPLDFIEPTADQIAAIRKAMPEISPSLVPAGTYPALANDYQTVGLYNFAVAHTDLADDLVYKIVKAVFENREQLIEAQSSAKETVPANITRDTVLPLHPGALRYYRELGVTIPPGLVSGN
jgi:TRAP transporter TAXI family solute receptor